MFRRRHSLITLIYIVIGIIVASNHDYLNNLDGLDRIVSAILAILLWPLVLFDANLHVHF
ncbi:MAG: hypothetical protein ACXWEL_05390 [Solirubrobacterales bacterium]